MRTVYLKEDAEAPVELSTGFLEAGCAITTFLRWEKFQPSQSKVEAGKKVVPLSGASLTREAVENFQNSDLQLKGSL